MVDIDKFIRTIWRLAIPWLLLALACYVPNARSNGWEHTSIDFGVLVEALHDANPNVRLRAAESLGFRPQSGATGALLARLEKNESVDRVRQEIYTSLGRIGEPSALAEIENCLLVETAAAIRVECANALGNFDSRNAERLALQAIHDPNIQVRLHAIKSLGSFSGPAALQALADLARDKNDSISQVALLSLGRTRSATGLAILQESLSRSENRRQTLVILRALTFLANPDAIADIQALYRKTDDEEVRRYALVAMASTRARGSESYFLEALSSEDHASRILGLAVLRNFGSRDQADAITEHALLDGSRIFRQDADALLLEAQSTIASLELLNEYLRTVIKLDPQAGESLYLQAAAVKSVPRSSSAALKIAQQLYQIRWQAIYGLGYTGAEQAAEIVATALKDPDPRIRAVALRSLGVLGNAKYHDSIVAMLNDRSAEVRWMAARVLGRSGVESASETLIRSLADTNAQVRLESALALGYLNAAAAKMKLSELASKDPDSRVQEAALYAASLIK